MLSIIIPHFNSVDSLARLLNSIPENKEIEIIVVDDNSNKDLEKLNHLIQKYGHVSFMKNSSNKKGAGACRNIGMNTITGDWVLFADSDDYFVDDFYEIIKNYLYSDNDVIFFSPTSIEADTNKKSDRHLTYEGIISNYLKNKGKEEELKLRYEFPVPWTKMISVNFIKKHNISFDEEMVSNDVMFSTKIGYYMQKFKVSNETIYCVTKSKGSLINSITEDNFNARLRVRINYCLFLKEKLDSSKLKKINISGRGMLYNAIIYKIGIKKTISTYLKLRRNGIKILNYNYFSPYLIVKKIIYHYKKIKSDKRYMDR